MEYCENGDLFEFMTKYIEKNQSGMLQNDPDLFKSVCLQLINALSLVHNKAKYVHLDLKLENILVSSEGKIKLCDFGFS